MEGRYRVNRYTVSVLTILLLFAIFSNPSHAQQRDTSWNTIVQWDNDRMVGTDRDYTNGFRLGFLKPLSKENSLDTCLRDFTKGIFNKSADWFDIGIGVTQLMYTPSNHRLPAAPSGQRPYAGWLGMDFSVHGLTDHGVTSVTLSLGTTGDNSFAQEAQDNVHRHITNSPQFQGWSSQVPEEVTFNLHLNHQHRFDLVQRTDTWPVEIDAILDAGAEVGNLRTNLNGGGTVRVGVNLPSYFLYPGIKFGSFVHHNHNDQKGFFVFAFAGARGGIILHDITLDGPVFRDFHTGTSSKCLVGEVVFGASIGYKWFELSYAYTMRTDEFRNQDKSHNFGSIMLNMRLPF